MHPVTWQGQCSRVGGDPTFVPQPLPAWWPQGLPAHWQEIDTSPWTGQRDRAYARAYIRHGGLTVIATCAQYADHRRWVHISVSRQDRTLPSWRTMVKVKECFIGPDRVALQVLPRRAESVNIHPGVLHLWHCLDGEVTPDFSAGGATL